MLDGEYHVLNAGYDGYEAYREFKKFKRDLTQLKIDRIFWFLSRNDLRKKASIPELIENTKKAQATLKNNDTNRDPISLFIKHFYSLSALSYFNQFFIKRSESWVGSWKDQYYMEGLVDHPNFKRLEELLPEVEKFQVYLEDLDIDFKVVILPDRSFCKFKEVEDSTFYKVFRNRIRNGKSNVHFVYSGVCDNLNPEKFYLDYVHFNERGHHKLANVLKEMFLDN